MPQDVKSHENKKLKSTELFALQLDGLKIIPENGIMG